MFCRTFPKCVCGVLILTLTGAEPRRPDAATRPYEFHSAMPAYWTFLRTGTGASEPAGKRFTSSVVDPHRAVFEAVAGLWLKGTNLDDFVRALEGKSEQFHRAEREFPTRFDRAWRTFQKQATDLKPGVQVFLFPAPRIAIGGAVRPLNDKELVVFGAEEIAANLKSKTGFAVLVHHELTHLYHMQVNPEMRKMIAEVYMPPYAVSSAKLYQVLWLEGLAVHMSKVLNPTAPDKELLLSDSVAREAKALWPRLAADLRGHLDSSKKADIDAYLFDSDTRGRIPRRAGYYIGMRVAQRLAEKYPFPKLCRLAGANLRAEIERALRDLEQSGIEQP